MLCIIYVTILYYMHIRVHNYKFICNSKTEEKIDALRFKNRRITVGNAHQRSRNDGFWNLKSRLKFPLKSWNVVLKENKFETSFIFLHFSLKNNENQLSNSNRNQYSRLVCLQGLVDWMEVIETINLRFVRIAQWCINQFAWTNESEKIGDINQLNFIQFSLVLVLINCLQ